MFFMFYHKFDTASKNEQWTQAIAKLIMLNIAEISIKKIIEASMFTIQMDLIPSELKFIWSSIPFVLHLAKTQQPIMKQEISSNLHNMGRKVGEFQTETTSYLYTYTHLSKTRLQN